MIKKFVFQELDLKGAYLIKPFSSTDHRGELIKDYNIEEFEKNGIKFQIKETFYTISKRGVIRAIHFQEVKQQAKIVRCLKGHIYDVIVDLRKESDMYGNWMGFHLTEENENCLLVPENFGHGYLVIEDSIVSYKCSETFYMEGDSGILWNDPSLNITWPIELIDDIIISNKDLNLLSFEEYTKKSKN